MPGEAPSNWMAAFRLRSWNGPDVPCRQQLPAGAPKTRKITSQKFENRLRLHQCSRPPLYESRSAHVNAQLVDLRQEVVHGPLKWDVAGAIGYALKRQQRRRQ